MTGDSQDLETLMKSLVDRMSINTGEHKYGVVRFALNINGQKTWDVYTPAAGWVNGNTYEDALKHAGSVDEIAKKLRADAAALVAKADALVERGEQ